MKRIILGVVAVSSIMLTMASALANITASYDKGINNLTAITWQEISPGVCEDVEMPLTLNPETNYFDKTNAIVFDSAYSSKHLGEWCNATYQDKGNKEFKATISVRLEPEYANFESKTNSSLAIPEAYGADMMNPMSVIK